MKISQQLYDDLFEYLEDMQEIKRLKSAAASLVRNPFVQKIDVLYHKHRNSEIHLRERLIQERKDSII